MSPTPIEQHNKEIYANRQYFQKKPLLADIFRELHQRVAGHLNHGIHGETVEIGSGIGLIKNTLPHCLTTDIFPNAWIDRVENVYALSFDDETVSNFILFHILHHLRYPGDALAELHRSLKPGGRVIIFEHCDSSLLGKIVNSLHQEPVRRQAKIQWNVPQKTPPTFVDSYYAALGNATRIFETDEFIQQLKGWHLAAIEHLSCLAYILSGGFSKPQLFPRKHIGTIKRIERLCDRLPTIFSTCLLIVLEKS